MDTSWRLDEWARSLRAGQRSAGTIDRYTYHVARFAEQHPDPLAVTVADVEERLAACRRPEYAKSVRTALHQWFVWAARTGLSTMDPTQGCAAIKVPRTQGRPTPETVFKRALLAADPDTRLMLMLAGEAGLRRHEVAKVHSDDWQGEWLRVVGKGGHERWVALSWGLQEAMAGRPPGWAFPSPRRDGCPMTADAVGRRIARALGPGWSAHTLRHRCATRGYEVTHDIIGVQEQLGHASVATTQRYIGPDRSRQQAVARACG